MIASRFATAVCVLVGLALIPTIIHSYAGLVVEDGHRASALPETLAGFSSRPTDRSETWGERRFESTDWVERSFVTPSGEVTLTVVRSFDLKALYHHPELAVAYGTDFQSATIEVLPESADVPVHVLRTTRDSRPGALYVLEYDGRFVKDPIMFQIRTAGELLFKGRRAMTLFFARAQSARPSGDLSSQPAALILLAAVDAFVTMKPAP
jgi:hypothetical protein